MEQRLLVIDNVVSDAELAIWHVRKAGIACAWLRVESKAELRDALREFHPDLILCDFTLPAFNGIEALAIAADAAPDVPFIFVSGSIGEARAIDALKHGAVDYVLKTNLVRLAPAVQRALAEAAERAARRKAERCLRRLIHYDPLTGLAKRSLFCNRLPRRFEAHDAATEHAAVAVFDVERLGAINDSLGRHTGDLLLQCIAERLRRHFDDSENLAHLDGGTFAVWLTGIDASQAALQALHARIEEIFKRPLRVAGRDVPVIVRCGLAPMESASVDAETLVQNAEAALHRAKLAGAHYLRHVPEMNSQNVARLALEHRLRCALERNQFRLHYQPQVDGQTGRVVTVEALLRWIDPEHGLLAPAAFLQVLESTGLIVAVGDWVLEQAAQDCRRWQQPGRKPLRVAVNVSPVQLKLQEFGAHFLTLVGAANVPACGIDIEITEEALDAPHSIVDTLRALRHDGVRIAIDDFGTGYSSLGRLSELPLDTLKIDRSFTTRLTRNRASQVVVSTIITLAQSLGLGTVAEGVETLEQLKILDALGCTQSQGFLHSPPVPAEQLEALLAMNFGCVAQTRSGRA